MLVTAEMINDLERAANDLPHPPSLTAALQGMEIALVMTKIYKKQSFCMKMAVIALVAANLAEEQEDDDTE